MKYINNTNLLIIPGIGFFNSFSCVLVFLWGTFTDAKNGIGLQYNLIFFISRRKYNLQHRT